MKLTTIQASAFKSTFEVLKDILNDVNVFFRPDGMYIVTLDTARTSLIDMHLAAENFEEYECNQEEYFYFCLIYESYLYLLVNF